MDKRIEKEIAGHTFILSVSSYGRCLHRRVTDFYANYLIGALTDEGAVNKEKLMEQLRRYCPDFLGNDDNLRQLGEWLVDEGVDASVLFQPAQEPSLDNLPRFENGGHVLRIPAVRLTWIDHNKVKRTKIFVRSADLGEYVNKQPTTYQDAFQALVGTTWEACCAWSEGAIDCEEIADEVRRLRWYVRERTIKIVPEIIQVIDGGLTPEPPQAPAEFDVDFGGQDKLFFKEREPIEPKALFKKAYGLYRRNSYATESGIYYKKRDFVIRVGISEENIDAVFFALRHWNVLRYAHLWRFGKSAITEQVEWLKLEKEQVF